MMSTVDPMFSAAWSAAGSAPCSLRDLRLHRWVPVAGKTQLRVRAQPVDEGITVTAEVWRDAMNPALSRFETAATAVVSWQHDKPHRTPWPDPADAQLVPDPYASGMLGHGTSFQ